MSGVQLWLKGYWKERKITAGEFWPEKGRETLGGSYQLGNVFKRIWRPHPEAHQVGRQQSEVTVALPLQLCNSGTSVAWSESVIAQLCPTLCDPIDFSLPGSSVHGILQARILEWGTIPFSGGSSQPRDQIWVSCIAGRFFIAWATREAWLFRRVWGATMKRSVLRRKEYDRCCWKSEQDKVGIFLAVQWVGLEETHTVSHTLMQWALPPPHHTGKNVHNTESFLLGRS